MVGAFAFTQFTLCILHPIYRSWNVDHLILIGQFKLHYYIKYVHDSLTAMYPDYKSQTKFIYFEWDCWKPYQSTSLLLWDNHSHVTKERGWVQYISYHS